ncbi:MAG: hypothetical protein AUJ92_05165 [Armatimonadetes bacterium CG2_30_59_28]|nr:hypothetical protein [Armatimonadota bacterium]OIO96823.1 MAG: hypothetical protein AUJ92_05165 [Armatimonadetes bacterium CG2_30_59_28]PIX40752.1 MAG: hypothetical protein COZ56_13935 [Armatimonadetes bacterium CG_4_8_14_3_um_filter_58_9]PIY41906.1 MAG: hypothetical protein COZ05_14975 [Armatimonadetes bacterium CG_4_10_14_3_um_filter_59_10]PJB66178.1 MAG: hypothetical protein CO095_13340 [Armatimonadetes bacterium CG_4_9_14_3_um_filter_58_7]
MNVSNVTLEEMRIQHVDATATAAAASCAWNHGSSITKDLGWDKSGCNRMAKEDLALLSLR